MTFGTSLVAIQLVSGGVIGVIAVGVGTTTDNEALAAVLTAAATSLILFGLITAVMRPLKKTTLERAE